MINLVLLLVAILGFSIYFTFMTVKFTRHIKITNGIIALHIISSIIAFFSVIPLLIYNFKINFFSIIFVIIFILGILVIYASSVKIKDQALKPHGKLIISGVYKNVRNPMYLGIILLAYSCFFISFSLYVLSYALTVNLLYLIIINAEEKDLIKQFGKDYINYKKKVPSLIPRL